MNSWKFHAWTKGLPRLGLKRRKSGHGFQIAKVLIVADVQAAGIAQGLKVPRRIPAVTQRIVDEVAAPLARDHLGMQGLHVPAPRHLRQEFSNTPCLLRGG